MKKRVLFVCLGNICRSPTAETIFRTMVAEKGVESEIEIESAGALICSISPQSSGCLCDLFLFFLGCQEKRHK